MRSSFYLAAFAQFGTAATWATPSSHLGLASAFLFVCFALFAIGYVVERGWNEPPEVTANKPKVSWVMVFVWVFYPMFFAVAAWSLIWYQTWGPLPALVVCLACYVLSFVFRVRENRAVAALVEQRRARNGPAPVSAVPSPKLVGLPAHAPGETFLVCLTSGEHTVRGRIREHSSPPLNLRLSGVEAVHLVLEPDGTDLEALPKLFDKARYLRITRRDSPWRGPGAGVRQVIQ